MEIFLRDYNKIYFHSTENIRSQDTLHFLPVCNLDFKHQARVVKFEIMDAFDTRITKIKKKILGHKSWWPF